MAVNTSHAIHVATTPDQAPMIDIIQAVSTFIRLLQCQNLHTFQWYISLTPYAHASCCPSIPQAVCRLPCVSFVVRGHMASHQFAPSASPTPHFFPLFLIPCEPVLRGPFLPDAAFAASSSFFLSSGTRQIRLFPCSRQHTSTTHRLASSP